jgi:hypothetical protein
MAIRYERVKNLTDEELRTRFSVLSVSYSMIGISLIALFFVTIFAFMAYFVGDGYIILPGVCALAFEIFSFLFMFLFLPYFRLLSKERYRRRTKSEGIFTRYDRLKEFSDNLLLSELKRSRLILLLSCVLYDLLLAIAIWAWWNNTITISDLSLNIAVISTALSSFLPFAIGYYGLPYFLAVQRERKKRKSSS